MKKMRSISVEDGEDDEEVSDDDKEFAVKDEGLMEFLDREVIETEKMTESQVITIKILTKVIKKVALLKAYRLKVVFCTQSKSF